MTVHIDLLVDMGQWQKALEVLSEYEQLPYISYEIEELFPLLKAHIFRQMQPRKNEQTIEQRLDSSSEDELIMAINELYAYELTPYRAKLRILLKKEEISVIVKSLILLLLTSKKEMETYLINRDGMIYELVPYELDPIISSDEIKELISHATCFKNVSMCKTLEQMIMHYALLTYPQSIGEEDDQISILYAAELLVYKAFNEDADYLIEVIKANLLDFDKITLLSEIISEMVG